MDTFHGMPMVWSEAVPDDTIYILPPGTDKIIRRYRNRPASYLNVCAMWGEIIRSVAAHPNSCGVITNTGKP